MSKRLQFGDIARGLKAKLGYLYRICERQLCQSCRNI